MTPRDFALYDLLDLSATAVHEALLGRGAFANAAWLEAWASAERLFAPHSAADAAVGVILAASSPDRDSDGRAVLWNALSAASSAALYAMRGDRENTAVCMPAAFAAVGWLEPFERGAVTTLLAEVERMAEAGDEVTA